VDQARGCLLTARFYESKKKYAAARIYYNEVVEKLKDVDPNSHYAAEARQRIAHLPRN
jgi:outer membrane protein assembly factor BamD (BamD/ComL family)